MTSAAPLVSLADFPDRLSPMVVKELRQGMRTRLFGAVFLMLHLLLILVTLVSSMAKNADDTRWLLDGLTILVLCVILPLRGFSALAEEIKANTLETLVLTQLSAARIVFGKWASIAMQSLLVALSLMPYVVARYVFGGTDLLGELEGLGLKWLAGVVIAAGIVCLSTQKQFWLRALVVGITAFGPGMALVSFAVMSRYGVAGRSAFTLFGSGTITLPTGMLTLGIIGAAAWMIFFFLSLAATRIAPAASHLAVVKRLVHAGSILVVLLAAWAFKIPTAGVLMLVATMASLASVDALIEVRNEVPSLLIPFYRRSFAGRVAAWFLTPGWPNGMVFSGTLASVLALLALSTAGNEVAMRFWLSLASTWMCASLVHLTSAGRWRDLLAPYIGMSIFLMIVQFFVMLIANTLVVTTGVAWIGVLMPGTVEATLTIGKSTGKVSPEELDWLWRLGFGISCLWPLLLALQAGLALHQTRHVRTEARLLTAGS